MATNYVETRLTELRELFSRNEINSDKYKQIIIGGLLAFLVFLYPHIPPVSKILEINLIYLWGIVVIFNILFFASFYLSFAKVKRATVKAINELENDDEHNTHFYDNKRENKIFKFQRVLNNITNILFWINLIFFLMFIPCLIF